MTMSTYYTLLGIPPTASREEIDAAYTRQLERYRLDRVEYIDDEMRRIAEERTATLEHAYQILSDAQRRQQYDIRIGAVVSDTQVGATAARRTISTREIGYTVGGIVVALALIAVIWVSTGRERSELPAVGEVDRPAPNFTLATLDGEEVRLDDYRGKVVLLNFWGTWCEPCRKELPALQASYEQLREQGFVVVGVNLTDGEYTRGNTAADIRSFLDTYGVTYPIAMDVEGEVARSYRLFPLPTSYFVDPAGQIRYIKVGELTADEVTALFTQLQEQTTALRK